jgi:sugar/nucleoside kinase (ribokinase family)
MEQEFEYLLWRRKADIINQVKVSNSQNVYVVGEHSDNNISTASFEADFDSIIQDEGKTGRFFVKFDANGERIWGSYYWGSISNLSIDSSEKFTYQEKHLLIKKYPLQMLIK